MKQLARISGRSILKLDEQDFRQVAVHPLRVNRDGEEEVGPAVRMRVKKCDWNRHRTAGLDDHQLLRHTQHFVGFKRIQVETSARHGVQKERGLHLDQPYLAAW